MRRALGLVCALVIVFPWPACGETAASDPRAIEVADQVMKALGGKESWDRLHVLRWTFEVAVGDTLRAGRRH